MNVLVTGAKGFAGRNIVENLRTLSDGRNRTRPSLRIDDIYEYDLGSTSEELDEWCAEADFVLHFAGVNRPDDPSEFREGNCGLLGELLSVLQRRGNACPVLLSSSVQASLEGRFGDSEYGRTKKAAEDMLFEYGERVGVPVYVYRFPNLVGKWVRPNYNSAVGTFCYNIAHDLPITVNDPSVELELLFVEDLLEEVWDAMEGHPHRCDYPKTGEVVSDSGYDGLTPRPRADGRYCYAPVTHKATLSHIVKLLHAFHDQPSTLMVPDLSSGSFQKKLYSMYVSYLPKERVAFPFKMHVDDRGSFTELLHTSSAGQVSVNVCKPGVRKGDHWHNSKLEQFIVVSGHGLVQERSLLTGEVIEFEVSGEKIEAVQMLPGWTHNIMNLSDTEDLVTIMWCNEVFDLNHPDTFFEPVVKEQGV